MWDVPSQLYAVFGQKLLFFLALTASSPLKRAKQRITNVVFHNHLALLVTKSPFLDTRLTICPRYTSTMGPTWPKYAQVWLQRAPKGIVTLAN